MINFLITIVQFLSPANSQSFFEKIFYSRFYSFLSSFNILSPSQFGFRKGYSTSHAIFNLQSQISNCFNNNNVGV